MSNKLIDRVGEIALDSIYVPDKMRLRRVEMDNPEVQDLRENIKKNGVLKSLLVQEMDDGRFELLDGNHRYTFAKEFGLLTVPASIIAKGKQVDTMVMQIVGNALNVETKPMEYAAAVKKMLHQPEYEDMTIPEFLAAVGLKKSPSWLNNILNLTKLHPKVQELINQGEVKPGHLTQLHKLPQDQQYSWAVESIGEDQATFRSRLKEKVDEVDAIRKGQPVIKGPFAGSVRRKESEVQEKVLALRSKFNEATVNGVLTQLTDTERDQLSAYFQHAGMMWTLSLDEATVNAREEEKKMDAEKRKALLSERKSTKDVLAGVTDPTVLKQVQEILAKAKAGA